MQIHAALGFIAQWPESERALSVEVQFRGVLQAQHDTMSFHPLLRVLPMWLENRMPVDVPVVEEAVRRHRLAPTLACLGHTGHRVSRQSFHQKPRSLVQARIAELELLEFRLGPGRRFGDQCVHSKSKSKRDPLKVYKRSATSLKVNAFFRAQCLGLRDVYNRMV